MDWKLIEVWYWPHELTFEDEVDMLVEDKIAKVLIINSCWLAILARSCNKILACIFFISSMLLYPRPDLAVPSVDAQWMERYYKDLVEVSRIEELPLPLIEASFGVWLDKCLGFEVED